MVVIDLADDRALPAQGGCEEVVVVRSDRSNCSPVARWLAGGPRKASLLDGLRYLPNPNSVLVRPSRWPEKPALPVDEETMRPCGAYSVTHLLDPTDDPRPNVRGTAGDDQLLAIPANAPFDPLTWTPAGRPDGASIINAGPGNDIVTGSAGVDTVLGGDGNDTIRGLAGDDGSLEGEAGDDDVFGDEGDDLLFGRTGDDLLRGGPGDDYLEGGRGEDGLSGGAGADRLFGGVGVDRLKGGPGDDVITSYDGSADRVDCGAGVDVAEVDRRDVVSSCETVVRPVARRAPARCTGRGASRSTPRPCRRATPRS